MKCSAAPKIGNLYNIGCLEGCCIVCPADHPPVCLSHCYDTISKWLVLRWCSLQWFTVNFIGKFQREHTEGFSEWDRVGTRSSALVLTADHTARRIMIG